MVSSVMKLSLIFDLIGYKTIELSIIFEFLMENM